MEHDAIENGSEINEIFVQFCKNVDSGFEFVFFNLLLWFQFPWNSRIRISSMWKLDTDPCIK